MLRLQRIRDLRKVLESDTMCKLTPLYDAAGDPGLELAKRWSLIEDLKYCEQLLESELEHR